MDGNQQQNPQVNSESPNNTTQSATTPEGQQTPAVENPQETPAQFMDIAEHKKTSPTKKILTISFGFLFLSILIVGGYYLYTLLVAD